MRKQFINKPLITSLGICSAFVAFTATFATLYFRQEAFTHANNLKKIEAQCVKFENENLILSARIAQMQAPHYLRERVFDLPLRDAKEQILRVKGWNEYKELLMARNALAINTAPRTHSLE